MKKQLRNALLATAALAMGVSANATGTLTVAEDAPFKATIDWETPNPSDWALNIGRGATGRPNDNAVYVNAYTVQKIYKMDANGVTEYMTTDGTGTSIGSDNAGNLYWPDGGAGTSTQSHVFKVLPAGKTSMADVVTITCEEPNPDGPTRADNIGRALGDFFSEEGAMVYACPNTRTSVNAFWIKNGECSEAITSVEIPVTMTTFYRAQPWATSVAEAEATGAWDSAFYLYCANSSTIYCPNKDFDGFDAIDRVNQRSAMAFDWFMLGDEAYLVYGAKLEGKGASWCNGDIVIVRQSDNKIVATYEAEVENPSGQAYAGITCFPDGDNKVKISVWNSRSGAYQLTVALDGGDPVAPLYAAGDFQGWDPATPVEFTYADGVYSYTFPEGTGSFKMSTAKGTWDEFNVGVICVADDKRIEDNTGNTKYALYPGGNANINFGYTEGQWTAYVDLANNLIWATNATDKPVGPVPGDPLYIVGDNDAFDAAAPAQFTYDAAKNVYTYNVTKCSYGFKISTAKGDWSKFDAAGFHTAAALETNVATELLPGSPANGGNITTTVAAPYVVEVSGDLKTITIVSEGKIDVPATCCVVGELAAGKWDASKVAPLTLKDDGYTYYGAVEMAGGWFSLCEKAGAAADDWAGVGTRWGAQTDGTEVTNNNGVTFLQGTNAFNIVSFADYPKTLYFTVNFKDMTVTVSDAADGVESIDADNNVNAEYYNLQGIRVNEPVKGQLYIVRQGNKVSKVIL